MACTGMASETNWEDTEEGRHCFGGTEEQVGGSTVVLWHRSLPTTDKRAESPGRLGAVQLQAMRNSSKGLYSAGGHGEQRKAG